MPFQNEVSLNEVITSAGKIQAQKVLCAECGNIGNVRGQTFVYHFGGAIHVGIDGKMDRCGHPQKISIPVQIKK